MYTNPRLSGSVTARRAAWAASCAVALVGLAASAQTPVPGAPPVPGPAAPADPAHSRVLPAPSQPGYGDGKATPALGGTDAPAGKPPEVGTVTVPVPGNPLVLSADPTAQVRPAPPSDSRQFRDYRDSANHAITPKDSGLPLFGYDFFRYARDIIDAHRAYIKRLYTLDNSGQQANGVPLANEAGASPTLQVGSPGGPGGAPASTGRAAQPGVDTGALPPTGAGYPTRTRAVRAAPFQTSGTQDSGYSDQSSYRSQQEAGGRRYASDDGSYASRSGSSLMDVGDPLTQLTQNIGASVPANYQLAPGDLIRIEYWSPTQETQVVTRTISAQGEASLDGMTPVVLLGKTVDSAEKALQRRLRQYYKDVEVSVTLGRLRTIQVTVSGDAYQPGTFSVPAVATAYNVLAAAGGPTEDGSLRNIQVRRGGKLVGTLDLYKFQLVGAQAGDIALQTGDLIVIPPRLTRVAVTGEVLHPAIVEITAAETLRDALAYAGGVKASGVDHNVRINTVDPGNARIIRDIDLKRATPGEQHLYDGDSVEVFSVRPMLANRVTIQGAVDQPNDYALSPNMRVSDLVLQARGPISEAYLQRAELRRWNTDNTTTLIDVDIEKALTHDTANDIPLQKWDKLKLYTREEVAWTGHRIITVKGAVQKPGIYDVSKNMHVSDVLRQTGGPTPDANVEKAFLIHQHDDGPPSKEDVNIAAIARGDAAHDLPVQDNDQLIVYTVRQAQFTPDHVVTILGEVNSPGLYPRTVGMKLSELLDYAGGFRPSAGTQVVVTHARRVIGTSIPTSQKITVNFNPLTHACAPDDDAALQDDDVVMVQGQGGYEPAVMKVIVDGAVNKTGYIPLTDRNMRLSDAIRAAGGLRPEAFPQGAMFYRDPSQLTTPQQLSLTNVISGLNDLLNDSEFKRAVGQSRVEVIKATNKAILGDAPAVPGVTSTSAIPNAAGAAASSLGTQDLVSQPRRQTPEQLRPDGDIAVNLVAALKHPGSPDDVVLKDGDAIHVPQTPTTVQVVGAVYHGRGVLFAPGARIDYYIAEAGGFAPDAASNRIEIIRPGGGAIPAAHVRSLESGDVILVPTKVLAAHISSGGNNIGSMFSSVLSGAFLFKLLGL